MRPHRDELYEPARRVWCSLCRAHHDDCTDDDDTELRIGDELCSHEREPMTDTNPDILVHRVLRQHHPLAPDNNGGCQWCDTDTPCDAYLLAEASLRLVEAIADTIRTLETDRTT